MKIQRGSKGRFLLSFAKDDFNCNAVVDFIIKISSLREVEIQSKFNYILPDSMLEEAENFFYYPFTKKEDIESEIARLKFLSQFETDILTGPEPKSHRRLPYSLNGSEISI